MQTTNNTILITGGGSGIGRGLAEAFHKLGNQVIIAGRRQKFLDDVTKANPGMEGIPVDLTDAAATRSFAGDVSKRFPALNVLINNAGIMRSEKLLERPADPADSEAIVTTNLLAPIRLTAALLPFLAKQPRATIMTVSSGLAFVPLSVTPTYCATKAAIHSYTQSLRHQLLGSNVEVMELIPPYVQTDLMNGADDARAMPLAAFIAEVMCIIESQPDAPEICVENVKRLRFAADTGKYKETFEGLNGMWH